MNRLLSSVFGTRKRPHDEDGEDFEARDTQEPRMLLLVRDASSLGAYQLHSFESASDTSEFVRFWFPPGFEHGALAFWFGHDQGMQLPGFTEKRAAEVLVLIHSAHDPEIVHPFAMPDMELARAWLQEEQDSGLDLHLVSIHWAARAEIFRDERGRPGFRPVELPAYQPPAEQREEERVEEPEREVVDVVVATAATKTRIVRKEEAGEAGESAQRNGETPVAAEAPEEQSPPEAPAKTAPAGRWEQRDEPFSTFGSPPGRF